MGFFELFSGALSGFYALVPSFGLAIILLTVAVRTLLLPLSIKQTRSMREMQRIQPEIKKLQAKYKGNRQKMNEELMALYKEHNVNPFGGCLPILMQFPVLIGLFYVIREPLKYMGYRAVEEGGRVVDWAPKQVQGIMETIQNSALAERLADAPRAVNSFLGIRLDCSASGILSSNGEAPFAGPCPDGFAAALPYLVFVLLMGWTTYYQQKQMQAKSGGQQMAQQMAVMMKIMPFMLMFFAYTFPLGVVLYWLTTNVWTIGQQQIMLRAAPPLAPLDKGDGAAPAKPPKGDTDAKPAARGKATGKSKQGSGSGGSDGGGRARKPHPSSKKKRRR